MKRWMNTVTLKLAKETDWSREKCNGYSGQFWRQSRNQRCRNFCLTLLGKFICLTRPLKLLLFLLLLLLLLLLKVQTIYCHYVSTTYRCRLHLTFTCLDQFRLKWTRLLKNNSSPFNRGSSVIKLLCSQFLKSQTVWPGCLGKNIPHFSHSGRSGKKKCHFKNFPKSNKILGSFFQK